MPARATLATALCLALLVNASCKPKPPSTEVLLAELQSSDRSVQQDAADRLLQRCHPRAIAYYQRILAQDHGDIRAYAASRLGGCPDPKSVSLLIGVLEIRSPVAQESLRYHLARNPDGAPPVEPIAQALGNSSERGAEDLAEVILFSLGDLRAPASLPYLVAALSSGSLLIRRAARIALVKLGSDHALPLLEREYRRAGNHSLHAGAAVMQTIRELKDPRGITLLIEGLADGEFFAAKAAGDALIELGDPAKQRVREALSSDNEVLRARAQQLLDRWSQGTEPWQG